MQVPETHNYNNKRGETSYHGGQRRTKPAAQNQQVGGTSSWGRFQPPEATAPDSPEQAYETSIDQHGAGASSWGRFQQPNPAEELSDSPEQAYVTLPEQHAGTSSWGRFQHPKAHAPLGERESNNANCANVPRVVGCSVFESLECDSDLPF